MSRCHFCGKQFKAESSRDQHSRDKHGVSPTASVPRMSKEGARAVMDEMGDLSDGAFFAMAADLGLEPEDFAPKEARGL